MGIFTISPLSAQAETFVQIREIRGQNPHQHKLKYLC